MVLEAAKDFLAAETLLADRVRLAIVATLAASSEPLDFNTLLDALELSKGNLSTHVRKLEEGGLVEVTKSFVDRKPRTTYACTPSGRRELGTYLDRLEAMLREAR